MTPAEHVTQMEHTLAGIARLLPLPDYVQDADAVQTFFPAKVASAHYADPAARNYPCHTKAAAWVSCARFALAAPTLPADARQALFGGLQKLAEFWNLTDDFAGILDTLAARARDQAQELQTAQEKAAVHRYGFQFADDAGTVGFALDLQTPAQIVQQGAWLLAQQDIPYATRQKAALTVLTRAEEEWVDLDRDSELGAQLRKEAGIGHCTGADILGLLDSRLSMLEPRSPYTRPLRLLRDKCAADMRRPAAEVRQEAHWTPAKLIEMADLVEQLDKAAGIRYGHLCRPPADHLFGRDLIREQEEAASTFKLASGDVYTAAELQAAALEPLEDCFGRSFVAGLRESGPCRGLALGKRATTLCAEEARLFSRMVSSPEPVAAGA